MTINRLALVFTLLLSTASYSNQIKPTIVPSEPFIKRKPTTRNKKLNKFDNDSRDLEADKQESLPLTPEERARKELKRVALGGAIGGTTGAAIWGAATTFVYVKNSAVIAAATAKGATIAPAALIAFPGTWPLVGLAAVGTGVGALFAYSTSE